MKSYSSRQLGWLDFFSEAKRLYRTQINNASQRVGDQVEEINSVELLIKDKFGLDFHDLDILEIGPGQFLTQLTCLAVNNRAVGADLEVIAQGVNPLPYLRMVRTNGLRRTIKTIGRKILGIDRKYRAVLMRHLNCNKLPIPSVVQTDATDMTFKNEAFDFVYCRSVLHHVPQPTQVLKEISRILRPGGAVYISIHLFTSETGSLDPRVFSEQKRIEVRGWPHLRPQLFDTVKSNAYLNRLRLSEWKSIFEANMPGVSFILNRSRTDPERIRADAIALQNLGQLLDYSLEELETFELVAIWEKTEQKQPKSTF